MPSIVVRGLDEAVKRQLADQAKEHGRSMEAEVGDILTRATSRHRSGLALLDAARLVKGGEPRPLRRRRLVDRAAATHMFRNAPAVDRDRFIRDLDEATDQGMDPRP